MSHIYSINKFIMTSEVTRDFNETYVRIFHHRQFLSGEIDYCLKEFEQKRDDREVEHLFSAVQTTTEIKAVDVQKCRHLAESNLPLFKIKLDEALALCDSVLNRDIDPKTVERLNENRAKRKQCWQRFLDDMNHKQNSVENTFEEKEEELREFYSDLERKLIIHK